MSTANPIPYDNQFYKGRDLGKNAARTIAKIVLEHALITSVVDIGCATGTWLAVFSELGASRVAGLDGPWVPQAMRQIPPESFIEIKLDEQEIPIIGEFDLAMSLEVAEHLPAHKAPALVGALTSMAPLVLFSASAPFQPNAINHINEQWPRYWVDLFAERGYVPIDCVRKRIWSHPDIVPRYSYYAQNILLFARQDYLASHESLRWEAEHTAIDALSLVHPDIYLTFADPGKLSINPKIADQYANLTLGMVLPLIPRLFAKSVMSRLRRLVGN